MNNRNRNMMNHGAVGLLLAAVLIVLINVLAAGLRIRADLTEDNLYTLTEGTRTIVGRLDRPVTLKFYFSGSHRDAPVPLKQYGRRIRDLLGEYEQLSDGRIELETFDPEPDSEEEEWAMRYGLVGQPLSDTGPAFYLGLVAVSGRNEAALPVISPALEPQLEYRVTRMIHEVTRTENPVLGVMSPLPVSGSAPAMNPFAPQLQQSPAWVVIDELQRQYEVRDVPTDARDISDDIQTLLVIHPKDFSPQTLFALDQFVLRGGRLLAFTDPQCLAETETMPQQNPYAMMSAASDLNALMAAWGLQTETGNVVGDPALASQVSMGREAEMMPTWLSLRSESMNRNQIALSGLELLMMPFAGGITTQRVEGLTLTPLLHTTHDASLVNSFQASSPGVQKMQEAVSAGQVPLAVLVQGTFPTAFPDGPPADGTNAPPADLTPLRQGSGTVVLVSDADMLYDRFCMREISFFGQPMYEPINDNFNFLINLVEQMSGSQALIGLRSRGTYERPFHRVRALEQRAREKWQQEELRLMDRLEQTQQRINELQQAKSDDQAFIVSPEQQAEIEKFREQRFETQQKLKDVRKNLRRDIERLGMTVKVLNIAAMPILIGLIGIGVAWHRKRNENQPAGDGRHE